MTKLKSAVRKLYPLSDEQSPKEKWGKHFDGTSGFALPLTPRRFVSVFVDKRFTKSPAAARKRFLMRAEIFAHCTSNIGIEWTITSEPVSESEIGLIAYSAPGKAIMCGRGSIDDSGTFRMKLSPLYAGITNACRITKASISAKYSTGGEWGVAGEIEGQF